MTKAKVPEGPPRSKVDRMTRLPENPEERVSWDKIVQGLGRGDRLKMIRHQLAIMSEVTPQPRLRALYACMANDAADLIAERDGKE